MTQRKQGGRKSSYYYFIDGEKFNNLSEAAKNHKVSNTTILNWTSDGKKSRLNCWREPKYMGTNVPDNNQNPGNRQEPVIYETAEQYLLAVIQGVEFADSARITAARCLLAYQLPKKRVKPQTPTPKEMRRKERQETEAELVLDFQKKAALIRKKHREKSENG